MSQLPTLSVIITSYNQIKSLRLLFASLERQTWTSFEVVIADDGSSDGTPELCDNVRSFPLVFVTQPDEGYRKARIVNEAVRRSRAEYLVFLDGDVILEKHFLEDHISLRKPGHFVCGRRVDLGPAFSRAISVNRVREGEFDRMSLPLILSTIGKDTIGLKRAIRVTQPKIRRLLKYHRPLDILGSNFSMWKADLLKVNGFNEALESYWGEDGDLYVRLRNIGKKAMGAKSMCVQYHVYHPRRIPTPANQKMLQEILKDTEYRWAPQGMFRQN